MREDAAREANLGLAYGLGAYLMWGFFPIYWKFLQAIPAGEILAHRMVWSLLFVGALLGLRRRWQWARSVIAQPMIIIAYLAAASFLAVNWGLYIWSVNSGHVVETALGYFINPLVNVLFGALLLGERPRPAQWAAIAVAGCGVLYLTLAYGQPPWIALTLAGTFAVYGLIKKKAPLGALEGLSLETALLCLPALGYLIWLHSTGEGAFGVTDARTHGLLIFSGVATALPLLCFAAAVRRLTLTAVGILQYLAPSIQFLLGVLLYKEPFTLTRLVGFALIWSGLLLYTIEGLAQRRRNRLRAASTGA